MNPRPVLLLALACTCAAVSAVPAQDGDPPGPAPSGPAGAAVLTEEAAVLQALRGSPTLQGARHERNVGLIEADRSRPAFRPQVNARASQSVVSTDRTLPRPIDRSVFPHSQQRFEITMRQQLFQFGAGGNPTERANAMAAAARSDYRTAELDTVLDVREALVAVRRADAGVEVAERGVTLARENVRITTLMRERGFQADVDVLEAERGETRAAAGLVEAKSGAALARANVNRLLGRPLETPVELPPAGELPAGPEPLEALSELAVRQRPEAEMLRHNRKAAEAGIRLAKASRLPRVDLEAGYFLQTETALLPGSYVAAGVSISAPLFDGGVHRFTVREAEERLAQLKSSQAALEQGIALEVQRYRLAMEDALAKLELARRSAAAAERIHEAVLARHELGRAVQAEVLNARLELQRALLERVNAEHDLRLARARLDRALGEGPTLEVPEPKKGDR